MRLGLICVAGTGDVDAVQTLLRRNSDAARDWLREQLGSRRLRFTDSQRRRLAAKAKRLGRRVLDQVATIVTPSFLALDGLLSLFDGLTTCFLTAAFPG
jgi:hypothetical protein